MQIADMLKDTTTERRALMFANMFNLVAVKNTITMLHIARENLKYFNSVASIKKQEEVIDKIHIALDKFGDSGNEEDLVW